MSRRKKEVIVDEKKKQKKTSSKEKKSENLKKTKKSTKIKNVVEPASEMLDNTVTEISEVSLEKLFDKENNNDNIKYSEKDFIDEFNDYVFNDSSDEHIEYSDETFENYKPFDRDISDKIFGKGPKRKLKSDKGRNIEPVMKKCKCCHKEKPLSEFNKFYNRDKQSHMDICKECEKAKTKKNHDKKREIINDLKSCGCVICGEKEPCCTDFHHIDSEHKEFNMGSALTKTDKRIIEEAAKCVVVCSNCHRKIHAGLIDIFDYVNPAQYQYLRHLINLSQCNIESRSNNDNIALWPRNNDDDGNVK